MKRQGPRFPGSGRPRTVDLIRRRLLQGALGGAASVLLPGCGASPPVPRAAGTCATLADIEHFVIFVQENRAFDHYFGSYRGVLGYGDPDPLPLNDGSGLSVFAQPGYAVDGFNGHLMPFHLDTNNNG